MPQLDKKTIDQILRDYFANLLSKSEEIVFLAPDDPQFDLEHEIDGTELAIGQLQQQLAAGQIDHLTKLEARELAARFLGENTPVPQDELRTLFNGILRARIESQRVLVAMLRGRFDEVEPRDPLFRGVESPGLPPLPGEEPRKLAPSVGTVIKKYRSFKGAHDWVPKTAAESARVLHWFQAVVGAERPVSSLTKADIQTFRDALVRLPKNATKGASLDGATFLKLAGDDSDAPGLSASTLHKYYNTVRSFLTWCADEYGIDAAPMLNAKISQKVNKKDARDPFSLEQLRTMFLSPQYTGHFSPSRRNKPGTDICRDGKFWLPLLGLYTGMRLGEIVQLTASDVRDESGVIYIDVNKDEDESGKSLKTATSKRRIPVHSEMVRIGFLDHVAEIRSKAQTARLFPEIKKGANGYYSHNISKYLGRFFKAVGVKTERNSFHSLRHNFADALREAEVEDSHIQALLGHSDKSTTAIYGSGVPLKVLAKDIQRVSYDLNLLHLYADEDQD